MLKTERYKTLARLFDLSAWKGKKTAAVKASHCCLGRCSVMKFNKIAVV